MNKKYFSLALMMVALCVFLLPGLALAQNNQGTEFQSLFDRVIGWVTGLPAIIIALGVGILGVVRAFQSGSFMWAFAGILTAATIFLLPTIVNGLGGSTF